MSSSNSKEHKKFSSGLKAFKRRVFGSHKSPRKQKNNKNKNVLSDDESNKRDASGEEVTAKLSSRSQSHELLNDVTGASPTGASPERNQVQSRIERLKNELSQQQKPLASQKKSNVNRLSHSPAGLDKMLMKNISPMHLHLKPTHYKKPVQDNIEEQLKKEVVETNSKNEPKPESKTNKNKADENTSTETAPITDLHQRAARSKLNARPRNRKAPRSRTRHKKPSAVDKDGIDDFFSIGNDIKTRTQAVFKEDTKNALDNNNLPTIEVVTPLEKSNTTEEVCENNKKVMVKEPTHRSSSSSSIANEMITEKKDCKNSQSESIMVEESLNVSNEDVFETFELSSENLDSPESKTPKSADSCYERKRDLSKIFDKTWNERDDSLELGLDSSLGEQESVTSSSVKPTDLPSIPDSSENSPAKSVGSFEGRVSLSKSEKESVTKRKESTTNSEIVAQDPGQPILKAPEKETNKNKFSESSLNSNNLENSMLKTEKPLVPKKPKRQSTDFDKSIETEGEKDVKLETSVPPSKNKNLNNSKNELNSKTNIIQETETSAYIIKNSVKNNPKHFKETKATIKEGQERKTFVNKNNNNRALNEDQKDARKPIDRSLSTPVKPIPEKRKTFSTKSACKQSNREFRSSENVKKTAEYDELKAAFTKVKLRSKSLKLSNELNKAEEIGPLKYCNVTQGNEALVNKEPKQADKIQPVVEKQEISNIVVKEETNSVDIKTPLKPIVRLRSIKNRKNKVIAGNTSNEPEWIAKAKRLSQNFSAKVVEVEIEVKESEAIQKRGERNSATNLSEKNHKTKRLSVPIVKLTEATIISMDAENITDEQKKILQNSNKDQRMSRRSTTSKVRRQSLKFEEKKNSVPAWMEMALKIQSDRKNVEVV